MNILQKLGNKIEKDKEDKKKLKDKYDRLSSYKRIDYDNQIDKIKKNNIMGLTYSFIKTMINLCIFCLLGFLLLGISSLFTLSRQLFIIIIQWLFPIFTVDVILQTILDNRNDKKIKELNKRFKLC